MHKLIKTYFSTMAVALLLCGPACKKNDPAKPEEALRISTNASPVNIVPGSSYAFNVTVESAMPASGVSINVIVKDEVDGTDYSNGEVATVSSKTTPIQITGLPRQKYCVATVTVTSKTDRNNKATAGFRVLYK